ncbi:MAG TPA: hypothetical protein VNI52_12310 [Sphingobacteriaceae bacterium]|nr:hypothetical protein [Sphingobacteriaceae bacterium]
MCFKEAIVFWGSCVLAILFFGCYPIKAQEQPKYIFLNSVPGKTITVAKPSTFNRKFFDDIIQRVDATPNSKIKVGISVLFDFLGSDIDSVAKSLNLFMQLSQETQVPILINLDGINWLNARPDLWNWWNPNKPGYNPQNKKNVEWTSWDESSAIKISWRNWGAQLRVLPAPNLSSPAIITAQINALNRLIPAIIKWYGALPANQKYLLGGVKLGHEASIGVNAYYYKNGNRYLERMAGDKSLDPMESYNPEAGFSGGISQIGFAAVKTAGIKNQGRITASDIEQVVNRFLDTLCKTVYNLGVPKQLIYTHQGGNFAPWEKHLSFEAGSNNYSFPGWSLYSTNPNQAGDLGDVLDKRLNPGWAAVEWWWPGKNKNEWIYNIQQTLQFKDCRFLAIFNWENGLERYPDGIEAVKEVIAEWK